jgi:hypothetical protein
VSTKLNDFEIKVYELNFARNESAHELRWKFMYSYLAGSLAFWGLIFSNSEKYTVPQVVLGLPAFFAAFGGWAYHAIRQNMRDRGEVMRRLEVKAGVDGWQSIRKETPKAELKKALVLQAYVFWATMFLISLLFAWLVRP